MNLDDYASDILTKGFLKKYSTKKVPWKNNLGYVVYKRTYSRLKEDGTTEEWWETVARCINGLQSIGTNYTKDEAERLYDYVFNFKCCFSGRSLWQLGTHLVNNLKLGDSLLNCFHGNTLVLTRQGWKPIYSLENTEQEIVTSNGKWVRAPFKSFGKQQLWKIVVKEAYSKENIEIYTTKGHEWILNNKGGPQLRIKTNELKKGDKLPIVLGKNSSRYLSPQGIQHGLVYGDGSCNGYESFVDLIDDCCEELNYLFLNNRISWKNPDNKNHIRYGGLPNYYKEFPDINENKPYLMGFLAGWIAADGSVSHKGTIRLFNKDIWVLREARQIASVCGLRTSEPYLERTHNPFNKDKVANLYSISFNLYDNPEFLILLKKHKEKLENKKSEKRNCDYATILSVKETDIWDDVYCAEVPETHSFVIEGNILTGNCWATKVSEINDFTFILMESMFGGGVGCNIAKEYSQELPRVKRGVKCILKNTKDADYIVPDSKEGWVNLWKLVLESYLVTGKSFTYSTICIRPHGEPLKTFGGISPGPKPLIDGTQELCKLLECREGKKLRTDDVADIICIGGEMIKSGGIRRTALILGGDVDDQAYVRLKRWDLGEIPNYRSNSNNSLLCKKYEHLQNSFWDGYSGNGEAYGLINLKNARRYGRLNEDKWGDFDLREPDIIMCNPCGEAMLEDKEPCNLAELVLPNIGSKEEMLDAAILIYKGQKSICAMNYYHEDTNEVVHKNYKIGMSVTGVCQRINEFKEWCDFTYRGLREFDKKWSKENNYNQSVRLTVVQPSGTKSLMFGVTPGAHAGYSRFFIRRVRFDSKDKLLDKIKGAGYNVEPEIRFDGSQNHRLLIASFPCSYPEGTIFAKDFPAIKQLELLKDLQKSWADQAVSITIYYKKEELPDIKKWLEENYDESVKSVSFLLHSDHGFAQAPYEEITEEKYNELIKNVKPLDYFENGYTEELFNDIECAGGACPIR